MKTRAFTLIELLVVIGIVAILLSLLFPVMTAYLQGAHVREMKAELQVFEAALAQYQRAFGDFPPSYGTGDNDGIENMLACLRTTANGGPFLSESTSKRWLGDTDGDGRQELVDPWQSPWIYFHPTEFGRGGVYYVIGGRRGVIEPVKRDDVFVNLTLYQLWACGPNRANESGVGDDAGNVGRE